MPDFLREKPGVVAALFIIVITVAIIFRPKPEPPSYKRFAEEEAQAVAEGRSSEAPAVQSGRVAQLNGLRYKDPVAALALAEDIVAKPDSQDDLKYAQGLIPEFLGLIYFNHQKVKNEAEARPVYERLLKEFPHAPATLGVRQAHGRELIEKLRSAIAADDAAQVEATFKEYAASGHYLPRRDHRGEVYPGEDTGLEAYASYQLRRWAKLSTEARFSSEGFAIISEALAPVTDGNGSLRLHGEMYQTQSIYGNEMQALAQGFEQRNLPAQACNAWYAAKYLLIRGRWEPTATGKTKKRTDEAGLQLSRTLEAGGAKQAALLAYALQKDPASSLCSLTPEYFLQTAIQPVLLPANRQPLFTALLQIAIASYLRDTTPLLEHNLATMPENKLPYETKQKLSEQLNMARIWAMRINTDYRRQAFENLTFDTNANLWASVPAQTIAEIERALPPNTQHAQVETARRELLRRFVRENRVPPPVETGPEFQDRWLRITALDGVYQLENNREEAFRNLRLVLNESTDDTLKSTVQKAVQAAFLQSRKEDKFGVLLELAGFYASEFAESLARDPFRDDFRKALETSASKLAPSDRMRRVFVQALLAAAFPDEEVGRKAQVEVIKQGFEVVASVAPKVENDPIKLPSGLPGYSTVAVENSTDYHILLIYDGPESFAVLCKPLRKGSFAVKNGSYRVAVMTPMGNIVPYHAQRTLADQHSLSEYHVETSAGQKAPSNILGGGRTYGNYTLLRVSEALTGAQVDPKAGTIKR
ncbi:MAG: hypothetical protein ACO1QS_07675 [Verrucomicrobiota bacterium]